ncbi:5'/3'-nucleotidase SurE [Geothermobacter hydrogeniphilus]|uniref:5'-nucleotidase SurE n=1 Tax=Geothermobacter hydrogeniphilus TaxID=1969733 RepID=A0A1X0YEF2_9BACT|nr:5'/3'-nucleotidase SurE [Geothermobacter hydrogeniphilus]ORJ63591.1 5'/3'-nucleotidase SurE [Geothermobacter hydrogeniphilus]
MFILITNDDGIQSPGIICLADELSTLGEIVVVAPDRERSAVGHALTLHAPLRADEIRSGWYAVDGMPTDCVNLGIHGLIKRTPDLVVSGINRGGNLGDDITYSGTVAAAMEATLMGVPAFAISLVEGPYGYADFKPAARVAHGLSRLIATHGLPRDTFFNVNVPPGDPGEAVITRQGKRRYEDLVVENVDPRGRTYYWIGGGKPGFEDQAGTDFHAIEKGKTSLTPLHLDLTNYRAMEELHNWPLGALDV